MSFYHEHKKRFLNTYGKILGLDEYGPIPKQINGPKHVSGKINGTVNRLLKWH